MGILGTMFSAKRGMDRYYVEILWNAWLDLKRSMARTFGDQVRIRGGISVGKGLQGPAGAPLLLVHATIHTGPQWRSFIVNGHGANQPVFRTRSRGLLNLPPK